MSNQQPTAEKRPRPGRPNDGMKCESCGRIDVRATFDKYGGCPSCGCEVYRCVWTPDKRMKR
jgi:hypothetical protein